MTTPNTPAIGYFPHHGQDAKRWIVNEVPMAAAFAVPSLTADCPVCLAGLSMGGYGALRTAGKFPERYCAVSAHSAVTRLELLAPLVEEWPALAAAAQDEPSLGDRLVGARERLPSLRFDCGVGDPFLAANRELHTALTAGGVKHVYQEFSGGHDWAYWEKNLETTFLFFSQALGTGTRTR